MYDEIASHLESCAKDDEIKFVVLTGTGEYFSSGADFMGGNQEKAIENESQSKQNHTEFHMLKFKYVLLK